MSSLIGVSMNRKAGACEKPKRDATVDTVKCLLILSIFVFHYGANAGGWYPFFGQFHVPAFFMVSGFWAMRRLDRSVWQFIKTAVTKYLSLWFAWVLIYPAFYGIMGHYDFLAFWSMFTRYFFAVRESGIGGMWFVPAFFLVSLCYFLTAKALAKIPRLTPVKQAVLHLLIALGVAVGFHYTLQPQECWLFSVDQVPIHWFYYALGQVVYRGFQWVKTGSSSLQRSVFIGFAATSLSYMVLMYCKTVPALWGALQESWFPIPQAVGVAMALCGLFWVARAIRCPFLARIGRATLGLCLCEIMAKYWVGRLVEWLGWSIDRPWMAFLWGTVALLFGCFVLLPPVEWAVNLAQKPFRSRKAR